MKGRNLIMRKFTKKFKQIVSDGRAGKYGDCEDFGVLFERAGVPTFMEDASVEDLQEVQKEYGGMIALMCAAYIQQKGMKS